MNSHDEHTIFGKQQKISYGCNVKIIIKDEGYTNLRPYDQCDADVFRVVKEFSH